MDPFISNVVWYTSAIWVVFYYSTDCLSLYPLFSSQAIRLSLEQSLPPEPEEEHSEPQSKLRIRTPSGEFIERRFLSSSPLQVLLTFVASKGFPCHDYKLLSTFPRRDVSILRLLWPVILHYCSTDRTARLRMRSLKGQMRVVHKVHSFTLSVHQSNDIVHSPH